MATNCAAFFVDVSNDEVIISACCAVEIYVGRFRIALLQHRKIAIIPDKQDTCLKAVKVCNRKVSNAKFAVECASKT